MVRTERHTSPDPLECLVTARRALSALALLGVVAMLFIAALTPLRSAEITALDAEARRLGEQWTQDQDNEALAIESNEFYEQARALDPPLDAVVALGIAMLLGAVAVAAWPKAATVETPEARADGAHV